LLLAANYIANDLVKIVRDIEERDTHSLDILPISVPHFRKLIELAQSGLISSRVAKDILVAMAGNDIDPESYAKDHGLLVSNDTDTLKTAILGILEANPSVVADFKAGKAAALEYLLGQCMRVLKGAGNPEAIRTLLKEHIS
jgi:aspartyl-tRNA(Asn)/glutamyl-tRNA(Gln) amidotransferase subunit B